MRGMPGVDLPEAHGAAGKIIKTELPTFVIEGTDKVEKVIRTDDDTSIRRFRESVAATDLKIGDFVIVIGTPNDAGEIEARLIRLMPPPPDSALATSSAPRMPR